MIHYADSRTIVLELHNTSVFRLRLVAGAAVGMVAFQSMSAPIAQSSQAQYRGQKGVAGANLEGQKK